MTRGRARNGTVRRACRLRPLAIACLLVPLLALLPSVAWAQTPGVTVINVPPEFRDLNIGTRSGLHHIDVIVSDYNSWEDILRVDLEILDESGAQVVHVVFQPYETNATLTWNPVFIENLGQVLVREQSLARANTDPQTIAERSELEVSFAIRPLIGRWLRITAVDLEGLTATAQVEYLTGALGGAANLPPLVLLLLAVAATVILIGSRVRREMHGG